MLAFQHMYKYYKWRVVVETQGLNGSAKATRPVVWSPLTACQIVLGEDTKSQFGVWMVIALYRLEVALLLCVGRSHCLSSCVFVCVCVGGGDADPQRCFFYSSSKLSFFSGQHKDVAACKWVWAVLGHTSWQWLFGLANVQICQPCHLLRWT